MRDKGQTIEEIVERDGYQAVFTTNARDGVTNLLSRLNPTVPFPSLIGVEVEVFTLQGRKVYQQIINIGALSVSGTGIPITFNTILFYIPDYDSVVDAELYGNNGGVNGDNILYPIDEKYTNWHILTGDLVFEKALVTTSDYYYLNLYYFKQ